MQKPLLRYHFRLGPAVIIVSALLHYAGLAFAKTGDVEEAKSLLEQVGRNDFRGDEAGEVLELMAY